MKKLNQQGIGHHLMIVAIAVIAVAGIGFAGWKVYERQNSDEASALVGYTTLTEGGEIGVYVCKRDLGTQWVLRTQAKNTGNRTLSWGLTNYSTGTKLTGGNLSAGQQSGVISITVSKSVTHLQARVYAPSPYLAGGWKTLSNIRAC
jgi:hypothetical protein